MITNLPYRVLREGKEIYHGNFPDEGQHNISLCRELVEQHILKPGDIIILNIKFQSALYPIAYKVTRFCGVEAVGLPEGVS